MKTSLILLALLLTGCCSKEPLIVTKEIKVPVPVACVTAEDLPTKAVLVTDSVKKDTPFFEKAKAVSIDYLVLKKENNMLWAVLTKCVETDSQSI